MFRLATDDAMSPAVFVAPRVSTTLLCCDWPSATGVSSPKVPPRGVVVGVLVPPWPEPGAGVGAVGAVEPPPIPGSEPNVPAVCCPPVSSPPGAAMPPAKPPARKHSPSYRSRRPPNIKARGTLYPGEDIGITAEEGKNLLNTAMGV